MSRPARAIIDLAALRHNYRLARERHGGRALAVIKANAYGHGALPCARALLGEADGFAVAFFDEAMDLRAGGIHAPILLLEGAFSVAELERAARENFWLVVHHHAQVEMLEAAHCARPLSLWLKINTGMNRAGFSPAESIGVWQRLRASGKVAEITLMTHFARADEPEVLSTRDQLDSFEALIAALPEAAGTPQSLANSSAILAWPQTHRDWARPGILLYGADPLPDAANPLRAVMRLESEVISVRELAPGDPLGYGGRFVAPEPMRVGLVALGYADGYPRSAPDGTPVAIDGLRSRLVGRVSMDMLTVDLKHLPEAGLGSRVELWGPQIPVNTVAQAAGTIAYELLCNVKRVKFVHVEGG